MKRTLLATMLCMSVSAVNAQNAPIKIVGSFDLSGGAAAVGKDTLTGVQFAVDQLNAKGGVLGRKVDLQYQDNGTNPRQAVDQATQLVQDGAVFLMAPQSSGNSLAVTKAVSAKYKMPMCISASGTDDLTMKDFQPYIFSVTPNSWFEMGASAARLSKLPYKRYALIGADYAGGRSNIVRFKEFLKAANPNIEFVDEEYPKLGAIDYTANINKVLASNPDYVFTIFYGNDLITFSKQAAAVGFFKQINNKFEALYDESTLKVIGDNAAIGSDARQRAPAGYLAKASPQSAEYIKRFRAKYGDVPSDWMTLAYDCVMTWAQAAEFAKTTDADPVMKAIETHEFSSMRGPLHFAAFDHQADNPVFSGIVTYSAELKQPVVDIKEIIPGSLIRPSEAIVMKSRQAQ